MQEYEITYLVENEDAAKNQVVEGAIKNLGGQIKSAKPWGQRNLAYPIGKLNTAFYVTVVFEMVPDNIRKLNRTLRLDSSIIRFLIVRGAYELKEERPEDRRYEKKPEEKTIEIKPREIKSEKVEPKPVEPKIEIKPVASKPMPKPIIKKTIEKPAPKPKAEKPAAKPVAPKKAEASDEERLKQLEDKLQDLLKE